jgi:hypothetical protein
MLSAAGAAMMTYSVMVLYVATLSALGLAMLGHAFT